MSTTGGKGPDDSATSDAPTAAFRRLLKQGVDDARVRVDALVALSQRTVFVATWPTDPESGIRTLTSSNGDTAMPVFTSKDAMMDAALRFGWLNPDGSLSSRETGAREALRRALARGVKFVVVDIGADHAIEFARSEIEPLMTSSPRHESSGPFAGAGKVSSALMEAVRKTSRPPPNESNPDQTGERLRSDAPQHVAAQPAMSAAGALRPARVPEVGAFPPERHATSPSQAPAATNTASSTAPRATGPRSSHPPARGRSITPDPRRIVPPLLSAAGLAFIPPRTVPADTILDVIGDALRRFPEVEWASAVAVERDGRTENIIALRVDPNFRTRVAEINRYVRTVTEDAGTPLNVTLVDEPVQVRSARSAGVVFYPWKKARFG